MQAYKAKYKIDNAYQYEDILEHTNNICKRALQKNNIPMQIKFSLKVFTFFYL